MNRKIVAIQKKYHKLILKQTDIPKIYSGGNYEVQQVWISFKIVLK